MPKAFVLKKAVKQGQANSNDSFLYTSERKTFVGFCTADVVAKDVR